ncbi:MAG: hypothetical protein ACXWU8_09605 [Rhodoplanes sp.]
MAWECKNKFWHGTRTYMMSGRKNPTPKIYTASLTANAITQAEKNQPNQLREDLAWPHEREQSSDERDHNGYSERAGHRVSDRRRASQPLHK